MQMTPIKSYKIHPHGQRHNMVRWAQDSAQKMVGVGVWALVKII